MTTIAFSTIRLPTLDAFKALTLPQRGEVFLNWVKAQHPKATYYPGNVTECALCQFGRALGGQNVSADAHSFMHGDSHVRVNVLNYATDEAIIFQPRESYNAPSTYRALAKRLEAHLNLRVSWLAKLKRLFS